MFSLEVNMAILGEAELGDRLEKVAYNALPGTMTADMWAHQYDQQANQVSCTLANRRWSTNGPASNIFGLEPNFGCCTANMHQGWPKLAANLWMSTADAGFAAVAYGPSEVKAAGPGGVPVSITEQTDYPFREQIALAVNPERPVRFPLMLRIPGWATRATVSVNGEAIGGIRAGQFLRVEREWKAGDKVALTFPMAVRTSHWYNNSIAVERGPLVYSLKIGESWNKIKQTGPASDWEIYPTTPWNYALLPDSFQVKALPMSKQPYSVEGAPVEIHAHGKRLPEWQMVDDSAGPLPVSPVKSKLPVEEITLIPYGAAKLRVTAFPFLP
jgi:DUF1680 family protein